MSEHEKVNMLMVDDQPAKLLSYEVILNELGENLLMAGSGREALEHLLKTDIAIVLMDVSMPELDGFELAALIRQHPRYEQTAILFISAVHLTDLDRLKGYEHGAVDYIAVPVVPEILRAKVRVFADLYRKTHQLARLLRRDGHTVEIAANGLQALARLQECAYDLILSDWRMPELDGPGLYQALAQQYPHLCHRTIIFTGDTLSPEVHAFFAEHDAPKLTKPITVAAVRRAIAQTLETVGQAAGY